MADKNFYIKFYKDIIPEILVGKKTLEVRPRSLSFLKKAQNSEYAYLTYGPRFGAPTVFAKAKIEDVEVRPFESVTEDDLVQIGYDWSNRPREEFINEYTDWFSKELDKGYEPVWVHFNVTESYDSDMER
ncbi:MAG TPA: hypothetical protein DCP90_00505 [Clostridiales bacterium]|nr:MAG: hypothetical protein A2Y22_08330 [Clostridiales bacterium GWD2_32_59]HAN09077.1 hypothetical protein [Clostridiales bacterium]